MKIQQQRRFQIEGAKDTLCQRAKMWAAKSGFILERESDDQMVFTRGSHWHAIYTFDIRKLPSRVSISMIGQTPLTVDCCFTVGSPLQFATPGDATRVSEQVDLLIGYLKGALE